MIDHLSSPQDPRRGDRRDQALVTGKGTGSLPGSGESRARRGPYENGTLIGAGEPQPLAFFGNRRSSIPAECMLDGRSVEGWDCGALCRL